MKNISIKIAVIVGLLTSIASISAMGRVLTDEAIKKLFTIKQIKSLNENFYGLTSNFLAKEKKRAESLLLEVWHPYIKKGVIPSSLEMRELDNYCGKAHHGVLNLSDREGHTVLKYILDFPLSFWREPVDVFAEVSLKRNPLVVASLNRRAFLKTLYDRGAELNPKDIFVMGSEKVLNALLNLPRQSDATKIIKVYRTFLTKNTEEKVWKRFNMFKMSGLQVQKRLKKVEDVKNEYAKIEKDLLRERQDFLRERYFKFKDLI